MINIRYHIVSITAVFLALGIGAALGGTFLDRYTVNRIDTNVRSAEARIKETRAENSDLAGQLAQARERDERLLENAGPQLLQGHLQDVPVLLVTAPGIDQTTADEVRTALVASDADLRGTLEVQDAMAFEETEAIDDTLADELGVDPGEPARARKVAYRRLDTALTDAAERPSTTEPPSETTGPGDTTTVPADPGDTTTSDPFATTTSVPDAATPGTTLAPVPVQPSIVTALLAADYLRFAPGPAHTADEPILATQGYRYVFVSGPDVEPAATVRLVGLLPKTKDDEPLPAVLVSTSIPEPADNEGTKTSAVSIVRSSTSLAARYSTVDDIENFSGQVAMVLAVQLVDVLAPAHYGQGEGASAVVPTAP